MARRLTWVLVALGVGALVVAGCSSSSTGPEPSDDPEYPEATTPGRVIEKIGLAYEHMDAEAYLDCLATDFILSLSPGDVTNDPSLPEYWTKAEETLMHESMFGEGTTVEDVSLDLTTADYTFEPNDYGDPMDDEWIYIEDVDLRVELTGDLTLLATAPVELRFRIVSDAEARDGQILWEIHEWYDLHDEGCGSCAGCLEDASWSSIRALFIEWVHD